MQSRLLDYPITELEIRTAVKKLKNNRTPYSDKIRNETIKASLNETMPVMVILADPFVLPNDTKLSSLLYADDLIILSRSKARLQNCLNALAQYCRSWMLNTNPKKNQSYDFSTTSEKI